MELLVRNYNLDTVNSSMCRNHLSVNWKGELYDCDFNQQLDLGIGDSGTSSGFLCCLLQSNLTDVMLSKYCCLHKLKSQFYINIATIF